MVKEFGYRGSGAPFCEACSTFLCCTGLLIMFPIGIICLPIGLSQWVPTQARNPATDFSERMGGCTIVSVAVADQNENNGGGVQSCSDMYTYTFTTAGSTFEMTSETEFVTRAGVSTCVAGSFVYSGSHTAGQTIPCYEPTIAVATAQEFYSCGPAAANMGCIKVLAPSLIGRTTYDAIVQDGLTNWIVGAVFLSTSLLCCLVGILLFCCRLDKPQMPKSTAMFTHIKPADVPTDTEAAAPADVAAAAGVGTVAPRMKEVGMESASS